MSEKYTGRKMSELLKLKSMAEITRPDEYAYFMANINNSSPAPAKQGRVASAMTTGFALIKHGVRTAGSKLAEVGDTIGQIRDQQDLIEAAEHRQALLVRQAVLPTLLATKAISQGEFDEEMDAIKEALEA